MPKIKRIIAIFESRNGRHFGFRATRCSDGKSVDGHITGGESNIKFALTNDGNNWQRDYYWYKRELPEQEIFGMPYAGCEAEVVREFVKKEMAKRPRKEKTA